MAAIHYVRLKVNAFGRALPSDAPVRRAGINAMIFFQPRSGFISIQETHFFQQSELWFYLKSYLGRAGSRSRGAGQEERGQIQISASRMHL